jgi:hypothetical protein
MGCHVHLSLLMQSEIDNAVKADGGLVTEPRWGRIVNFPTRQHLQPSYCMNYSRYFLSGRLVDGHPHRDMIPNK